MGNDCCKNEPNSVTEVSKTHPKRFAEIEDSVESCYAKVDMNYQFPHKIRIKRKATGSTAIASREEEKKIFGMKSPESEPYQLKLSVNKSEVGLEIKSICELDLGHPKIYIEDQILKNETNNNYLPTFKNNNLTKTNSIPNGFHILKTQEGTFKGFIKNKKYEGMGHLVLKSGYSYHGEYKTGIKCGHGKEILPDGSVYKGCFLNGERSGYGNS